MPKGWRFGRGCGGRGERSWWGFRGRERANFRCPRSCAGNCIIAVVSNSCMRTICAGLLAVWTAAAQIPTFTDLMQNGRTAYLQGKYAEAEKQYHAAVAEAEKTPDDRERL